MKKIILELNPETNRATWIVRRDDKRTRYNPTPSSVRRLDNIFDYLGFDYMTMYNGKCYLVTYAVERIGTTVEIPDDER